MIASKKIFLQKNNSNIITKPSYINISNPQEKIVKNFEKKKSTENREFGQNLTNISLTVFGKSNISQNKKVLKAIEIIKANRKNKERSREKSFKKKDTQSFIKNEKKGINDTKKNFGKMANMALDKKRFSKKNDINKIKDNKTSNKKENLENVNYNNINTISEFNLDIEKNKINDIKKEETKFISKISEVNIILGKDIFQKNNNFILKNISNANADNYSVSSNISNKKYDLQLAEEYQEEIIPYLMTLEHKKRINPNYMSKQNDINEKMRMILIDWLTEVHLKFKLLPETLFLTINFIDRYLQNNQTPRDKLQLIAVSSLLIACKYEEIYPPEISSFVYITDNAYKKEEILDYEIKILGDLEYDLTYPTPLRFLEILVIKLNIREDNLFLNRMKYLIELCLSRLNFYQYSYLELVIGCCLLLCEKEGNINRSHNVIKQFKLAENFEKLEKIKNCVYDIKKLLEYINENKNVFKGVRQKYAMEKFGCVSNQDFFL